MPVPGSKHREPGKDPPPGGLGGPLGGVQLPLGGGGGDEGLLPLLRGSRKKAPGKKSSSPSRSSPVTRK